MHPTQNPGYLLHHLAFTLDRQSDQILQEQLGIGFSQYKILMALKMSERVQQRLIAEKLGQTEASISRQIKLMHQIGLLSSRISPKNRREHLTELTAKGERVLEHAMELLNNYHAPMFEKLSDRQQEAFKEVLLIMHEEACQGRKPGACHH